MNSLALEQALPVTGASRIVAVIPACQEAQVIAATLDSIHAQSVQPNLVVVAANNCTDGTEEVAAEHGAFVFNANPNRHKKAGALNLALEALDPLLDDRDYVLVADADTTLTPTFIEVALANFRAHSRVGAVGGVFSGRDSGRSLGVLQQVEFWRYRAQIRRVGERAFVISGTGALFSVQALRSVRAARGTLLPSDGPDRWTPWEGDSFYSTRAMTEDNEISLALLALRWRCLSPARMGTTTDVMDTPAALWKQRQRWYLGALWNLHDYGRRMPWFLRWVYWRQQAGLLLALLVMGANLAVIGAYVLFGGMVWNAQVAWMMGLAAAVWALELHSVWRLGWRARLLVLVGADQAYATYLLVIFASAVVKYARGDRGGWALT